jgi:group I intron endonuclease
MLFEYQGFSRKGGIYRIKNTMSGVVYVGSAKRFKERWGDHARSLEQGKHHTKHLQNAYSKYILECGNDDFLEFAVLEVMENATKAERLAREEWWISKLLDEGTTLYNSNITPTKEPSKTSIGCNKGKHFSPATEYKAGHVPWTKENGHDEETRKLIGEKSKAMWENEASAAKLRVSRQSKKFRKARSKDMKASWKATKEERIATLNLPENREANSERVKKQWSDPESRQRILNARNSETSKIKRLISEVGEDKAAKILDAEWMKYNVETLGKKGTAKLLGVDVGTVRRWYAKFFPYEISSKGIEFAQ